MIKVKVYLYNSAEESNGYRGTDYTDYCLQGQGNVEDITQEVDTSEITLMGISRKENFTPSTKFILDIVEIREEENPETHEIEKIETVYETLHRIVTNDFVSQPIIEDDTYFKHEISLAEPSVDFQHRIVDNLAITYKLKNVTLETKTGYNLKTPSKFTPLNYSDIFTPSQDFTNGVVDDTGFFVGGVYIRCGKYLQFDGKPQFVVSSEFLDKYYIEDTEFTNNQATITLPKLKIFGGVANENYFTYIGDASYNYTITECNLDNSNPTIVASGAIISNSTFENQRGAGWVSGHNGWLIDNAVRSGRSSVTVFSRKYANPNAAFPNYHINITITPNKIYKITTSIYNFSDTFSPTYLYGGLFYIGSDNSITPSASIDANISSWITSVKTTVTKLSSLTYNGSVEYLIYSEPDAQKVLTSANPYSALLFIKKAIMNSEVYNKSNNLATGDINATDENGNLIYPVPVYIDNNYISELEQTSVVENFYNQKNLWEMFIEAGYYIHAIPEIKFGANDKYMLTFNRLGQTKETSGVSTPVAIYNFRGIDDYIAETDSYVANMVQLGGYKDEWVSPKSEDEDFLVCNDNAEIIVSSPIIELLGAQIRCNVSGEYNFASAGDTTVLQTDTTVKNDFTNYIFENNIYKILDVVPTNFPNMGISLYYELGSNIIKGCNYRLPTKNPGEYYNDYTLKKIIYCAFTGIYPADLTGQSGSSGYWVNIKVNDFSFRIIYRTKSDVRQSHTRPDLRKYLLNNKFDNVPIHRQFNNQQDVLVDSENFGANLYGTLIRTGNTNYKMQEWVSSPAELKHKGEIYRINDEIYYVSKINNNYYTDHIDSMVEYSKDYNQLSKIIGIPSEPRFYEISERSLIDRDVNINDYLYISTNPLTGSTGSGLRNLEHLHRLVLKDQYNDFARYGVLVFKGDKDMGTDATTFGVSDFYKEVIVPLNAYSSGGTLTYEMDMIDNFSAGDKVVEPQSAYQIADTDKAYKSLQAVQYTDMYGKATLFDYFVLDQIEDFTTEEIQNLPESPIAVRYTAEHETTLTALPTDSDLTGYFATATQGRTLTINDALLVTFDITGGLQGKYIYQCVDATTANEKWSSPRRWIKDIAKQQGGNRYTAICASNIPVTASFLIDNYNNYGCCLIKDCREKISINYNLKLITSSDTFIYSQFFFQPKQKAENRTAALSIVFLSEEVNKLNNGYFNNNAVITKTYNGDPIQEYYVNDGSIVGVIDGVNTRETAFFINFLTHPIIDSLFTNEDFGENGIVKSVVLAYNFNYQGGEGNNKFVLARNIPKTFTKTQALEPWYFQPFNKNIFTNKQ